MIPPHSEIPWQKLSPLDGHTFFGYYDRFAWNADNTLHLALKAPQAERLPERGETAEVGVLDGTGAFRRLARTRAWCHQQGAMTLWLPRRPGCFLFNDWDQTERALVARVCSVKDGLVGAYPRPIYALSPDGAWGASLNFARIPRRGYAYADGVLDPAAVPDLDRDGILVVNLRSGKVKLAVPYREILNRHPAPYMLEGAYVWLNHVIFNRDASKLLFLLRHCRDARRPYPWQTHLFTCRRDGSDLACPLPNVYWNGMISHQIWGRTPHEILVDANWQGQGHEYVVFDERERPVRASRISRGQGPMGHLVFSPDGRWLLADAYAADGWQTLALVHAATGECRAIGRFQHEQPPDTPGDVRCDLHPRWSPDGTRISVDSIHDGRRGVYGCSLEDCLRAVGFPTA